MKKLGAILAILGLASASAFANTCTAVQAGSTDATVYVTFLDETTGIPASGLAFNTSGIDLEYVRTRAAAVDITEATQTAAGAHSDGGFVSVGHGRYRLDLPDAAVATGVPQVVVQGVVTGYIMAPCTVALSPPANLVQVGGTAVTQTGGRPEVIVNSANANAFEAPDFSNDTFTAAKFASDVGGEFADATWDEDMTAHQTQGSAGQVLGDSGADSDTLWALANTNLNATVSSRASQTSVDTLDAVADAILEDTGTTGVLIAESATNCREVLGCDTQGTLTGSPTATTADLGTNAPTNDISGMTLVIPGHNFARVVASYDTGTGVATWEESTAATLASGNQFYLWATPPAGEALDAEGVREALGLDNADLGDQLATIDGNVDDVETRIGTPSSLGSGGTLAANNQDIEGQTDDLAGFIADVGTNGTGLIDIPWNPDWDTEAQSEADDAIKANELDHLFLTSYDPASKPGAADAWANELVESDGGVARFTANALEQAPSGGGGGGTDWTTGEKEQIRNRLGIDGDSSAPSATPTLATAAAVAEVESQTDDIGVAGAGLTNAGLTAAQMRAALGLNSANLDAQLAALGTDLDTVLADLTSLEGDGGGLPEAVRDVQIDGTRTLGCALAAIQAERVGKAETNSNESVFYDPTGNIERVSGTAPSPGNRTVVVTCPSN